MSIKDITDEYRCVPRAIIVYSKTQLIVFANGIPSIFHLSSLFKYVRTMRVLETDI